MISSASTLFFATLVLNAASVFGAPIRFPDTSSEVTARTEVVKPVVPVARADVIDLNDNHRRKFAVPRARILEVRDLLEDVVETREPAGTDEPIMRRYPRRVYHDFYEKREPEPVPAAAVVEETTVVRRYPRRALYERHEKREPATTVKETTMVVTKLTTHDTPADAAAFASVVAAGDPKPSVVPPLESVSASTIISFSQTTTIAASDSSATPTASSTSSAASSSVTAPPTETPTASSSASASGEPTPTSSGTAEPSATASGTPTSSGAAEPSATASSTSASDGPTPTGAPADPATDGANTTTPPADGGDKKDEPAATPATPAADGSEKPQGFTAPTRRETLVPVANTIVSRQLGISGAALASAVRRGLPLGIH